MKLLLAFIIFPLFFFNLYSGTEIYNALAAQRTYTITGIFGQHDFAEADSAFDWAFTLKSNGKSYQLQGKEATANDVFGWKEVPIETPTPMWYMFPLGGDIDRDGTQKFDWILAGVTTNAVYKLAGVSQSGNFLYSDIIEIAYNINGNTITFATNPNAPKAENISLTADTSIPYMKVDLVATDPNGDTVTYFLNSPMLGDANSPYELAFIEAGTSSLYITFKEGSSQKVELEYVASDGQYFSNVATVSILKEPSQSFGLGAQEIGAEEYGRISLAYFDGERFGVYGTDALSYPSSIDLSANMPLPGNQGMQNSCVAWAVGYALKSYHEKMELQWSLDTQNTLFSPAWIYNQINHGKDNGSSIGDAMQLIINKGAATMATMPYSANDYLKKPTQEAINEALNFKAAKLRRVSGSQQIKAALANRQPVVIMIKVYDSFNLLKGDGSVYTSDNGTNHGNHAVTVVGYDDDKYGGAFKVINSWGSAWGEHGYFWLPYDKVSLFTRVSYVLSDAKNGAIIPVDIPTRPVDEKLPNLQIGTWYVEYNNEGGSLQYEVTNTGNSIAYPGADINLMFSKDATIDSSDYYLVYETITTPITPGMSLYRNADNPREFLFPKNMEAGDYYMAMWVDDLDAVNESNESDNKSYSEFGTITVADSNLPDLSIDWWYTDWTDDGTGVLVYQVSNIGSVATHSAFDINLILSVDEYLNLESGGFYLYTDTIDFVLNPGEYAYRDENSATLYNLFVAPDGTPVPVGEYYMALWVDDLAQVQESNELNNYSVANGIVTISLAQRQRMIQNALPEKPRFNGKHMLQKENLLMQKVRLSIDTEGKHSIRRIDDDSNLHVSKGSTIERRPYTKNISSSDQMIFPVTQRVPMQ